MDEEKIYLLAEKIRISEGRYTFLLGAGASRDSDIADGNAIIIDLIKAIYNKSTDNPEQWFKDKFGEKYKDEYKFSKIFESYGNKAERQDFLEKYFEPTDEDRRTNRKLPNIIHKCLAKLAEKGYIKYIITTNYDRLIEKAFYDINLHPLIIDSPENARIHENEQFNGPVIIKINGDYKNDDIKATIEDLSFYDSSMEKIVQNVLDKTSLTACGWSGRDDIKLIDMIKNSQTKYPFYYLKQLKSPITQNIQEILNNRKNENSVIETSAIDFFSTLYEILIGEEFLNNIPLPIDKLYGRDEDIKDICNLCTPNSGNRLVSIIGFPGTGKTELVKCIGHSIQNNFKDGAIYFDFSTIQENNSLDNIFANCLNIQYYPSIETKKQIVSKLGNKKMLLIFDNCEHVISECKEILKEINSFCPNVYILATSRETLKLDFDISKKIVGLKYPGQSNMSLNDLENYPSIKLFIEQANKFETLTLSDDNKAFICEICNKVQGNPLAIKIIASTYQLKNLKDICSNFSTQILDFENETLDERHRSFKAVFDWSMKYLSDEERDILIKASLFIGGMTVSAITYLCDNNQTINYRKLLIQLVNKSLLYFDKTIDKYFMPLTLSCYLGTSVKYLDVINYINYYKSYVSQKEYFLGTDIIELSELKSIRFEYENLKNAINKAIEQIDSESLITLILSIYNYWLINGLYEYALESLNIVLKFIEENNPKFPLIKLGLITLKMIIPNNIFITIKNIEEIITKYNIIFTNIQLIRIYLDISHYYFNIFIIDKNLYYLNLALKISDQVNDSYFQPIIINELIKTYQTINDVSNLKNIIIKQSLFYKKYPDKLKDTSDNITKFKDKSLNYLDECNQLVLSLM